jgi:hypothetical protein
MYRHRGLERKRLFNFIFDKARKRERECKCTFLEGNIVTLERNPFYFREIHFISWHPFPTYRKNLKAFHISNTFIFAASIV